MTPVAARGGVAVRNPRMIHREMCRSTPAEFERPNRRLQRTRASPSARHSPLTSRALGGRPYNSARTWPEHEGDRK